MNPVMVLFEVTVRDGKMREYLELAGSLKEQLSKAEGFLRAERFKSLITEGKLLSMSEWENEESVARWRNFAEHRMCQKIGRKNDFADYKITVVTPQRTYSRSDRTEAPADSNSYLEV